MALKDLKSILSNFRVPKNDPLEMKSFLEVNKTQSKTPLSGLVDSTPKITSTISNTTKEGVTPNKMDNGSKFLGETNPSNMDNSSKFLGETNPSNMDNTSKFLGETTPKVTTTIEKFKGETTPKVTTTIEKFKGETTPTSMDNSSKFLGETNPTNMDNSSKFLGETNPTNMDNSSKFLGETNPSNMDNSSKFLGETNPSNMDNSSKFLGETNPSEANTKPQFLGETNTKPMSLDSGFIGETNTKPMSLDGGFLGETTPTPVNNQSGFLGETTPNLADNTSQFLGETTPAPSNNTSQFLGETTPTDVNYITDIHAKGFTSNQKHKSPSKFTGVSDNQTKFDYLSSIFSDYTTSHIGLETSPGHGKFKLESHKSGPTQKYNPSKSYYAADTKLSNKSISKLHEMRNSPSFLDKMYDKFNLRDDAYNSGMAAFDSPLILRGIQRKGITKGEPQSWGIAGVTFDDGLIRGGVITSTVRAAIDAVRIGKWMVSVKGLLFAVKQFGLQQSNPNVEKSNPLGLRRTKIWTPVNTLASILGQHIGLHPRRHGFLPLPESLGPEKYENVQKDFFFYQTVVGTDGAVADSDFGNRLARLYNETFHPLIGKGFIGRPFSTLIGMGGPNSLYGLIPGGKFPKRAVNTRPDGDFQAFDISYQYNPPQYDPAGKSSTKSERIGPKVEFDPDSTPLGLNANNLPSSFLNNQIQSADGPHNIEARGGSVPNITDYETIAYGDIPTRLPGDTSFNDFRRDLDPDKVNYKNATNADGDPKYRFNNIEQRGGNATYGSPGRVSPTENRYAWYNQTPGTDGNTLRYDKIQSEVYTDTDGHTDIVKLLFWKKSKSKIQFRGTVSGITDTFAPSWDSTQYNGRADPAYSMTSFERTLSLSFQVYATSRIEMLPLLTKLQALSTMTMPTYVTGMGYHGQLIKFTLGDLFKGADAIIDSLSYSISDEVPWDLGNAKFKDADDNDVAAGYNLPMGYTVSMGLKILGESKPAFNINNVYNGDIKMNGKKLAKM